ncbi:MAG: ABC transporter substrate-binding protein [Methanocella sp.]
MRVPRFSATVLVWLLVASLFVPLAASAATAEAALVQAAKAEGKVVVYAYSSRIADVKRSFEAAYPGITVEASDMKAYEVIEKIGREADAGVRNADVILTSDEGSLVNDLLKRKVVTNYVPADLVPVIPQPLRSPLLVMFIQFNVPFYNTKLYSAPPIDSWWDLTRPEWKGKVLMQDLLSSAETWGMFIAMVQHSDEMAAAYRKEFGQEIRVRKGETAGHEFMRKLLMNDPVFMNSGSDVVDAIGKSDKPLIGLASSPKLRDVVQKKLPLEVAWKLSPAIGVTSRAYIAMMNKAPHPNAAKLLIRWLMGDTKGGQGFAPYYVPGSWSSRSDVPAPPATPAWNDLKIWQEDPAFIWKEGLQVRDFWISIAKK